MEIVAFMGIVFMGVMAFIIYWLAEKNKRLQERLQALEKELKEISSKRYSHATLAGLEDALAIALDVIHEYADSQKYTDARIRQLQSVLQSLRGGPNCYDENRPAGKRIKRRFD